MAQKKRVPGDSNVRDNPPERVGQHRLHEAVYIHQPHKDAGTGDPSFQPVEDRVGHQYQRENGHPDTRPDEIQHPTDYAEKASLFPDFLDNFSGNQKDKEQYHGDYRHGYKEADEVLPVCPRQKRKYSGNDTIAESGQGNSNQQGNKRKEVLYGAFFKTAQKADDEY